MRKVFFTLILIFIACLSDAQTLYCTTPVGGDYSAGNICKLDLATNTLTTAFSFDGGNGGYPYGSLIQASDGKLYGMTVLGGSSGVGVIFSYDPATATYAKLKDFDGANGSYPQGNFVQASDGKLYGMTSQGGSSGVGVIFSYDPATATYAKLKDFDGANGSDPHGNLIQASDGKLYGMTSAGGSRGGGVSFSFDPVTGTYADLIDFNGVIGAYPQGSFVQASDGKLYGMNSAQVFSTFLSYGVIFSYDPATATSAKLIDFVGTNGSYPLGNLMQASDGKLYGMTSKGGSGDVGAIFSYDPATATYAKLQDFDDTNGSHPYGSLMQASNGKLYGMTSEGGNTGFGISFSYDPVSSTYTKLADFTGSNGGSPFYASFIEGCTIITWYRDADGDSHGDASVTTKSCAAPTGYVASSDDCDDNDNTVYPDAPEACDNKDNNCNGQIDEGVTTTFYRDADGDGHGDASVTTQSCSAPIGYVTSSDDCDDNDNTIYPNAPEVCDGKDNDCDGQIDEGVTTTFYRDADGDGHGNASVTTQSCATPAGYVTSGDDCDDNDNTVYPNAPEVCDGKDNDCDGQIDEGVTTIYYRDADGDGHGDASMTTQSCSAPTGYVSNSDDCDDNDNTVYPNAPEVCDGKDNDCDGTVDEGCNVPVSAVVTGGSVTEGNSGQQNLLFTVTLSSPATANCSVQYKTIGVTATEGVDYKRTRGTLNFAPGEQSKTIIVKVYGDIIREANERLKLRIGNAVNLTVTGPGIAIGIIANDDRPSAIADEPVDPTGISKLNSGKLVIPNLLHRNELWRIQGLPVINKVTITDANGKVMLNQENYHGNTGFTSWAQGMYYYQVSFVNKSGKEEVYRGKLVLIQ